MRFWFIIPAVVLALTMGNAGANDGENAYVGSAACKECHQEQYDNFMNYSKKADSFTSIKKMEKKLTPEEYRECFECHTTGYGKPGGFISETQTPEVKDTGCEVCHGPGSLHAESGDPDDIILKMGLEVCMTCHNQERVADFDFKPLMYGGAH
ncbi:MAG: cytochrome c family protein [Desulfobacterales bacterium]|nr:cytochrome c family protein [Desulfobacterales bacterium]